VGNADYGEMVQPSQQHVAPCVKRDLVGIGHERFENSVSVWACIPVGVTQEAGGVVPPCRRAAIGTPFLRHTGKWWAHFTPAHSGGGEGCSIPSLTIPYAFLEFGKSLQYLHTYE